MRLEYDPQSGGKSLIATISGDELFRLGRGDRIECDCQSFVVPSGRITLVCESPQSLELVADLKFQMRQLARDNAVMRMQLNPAHHGPRPIDVSGKLCLLVPTFGDSTGRLEYLLRGIRETQGPRPELILADDGGAFAEEKKRAAAFADGRYVLNEGERGIPGNLNSALKHCNSEWILVIDDGSTPSKFWLQDIIQILSKCHGTIGGKRIAMIGSAHIQDWQIRTCGYLDRWPIETWFYRPPELVDAMSRYFRERVPCPHTICWEQLAALWHGGTKQTGNDWPQEVKDFLRYNAGDPIQCESDVETEVCRAKYLWSDRWVAGSSIKLRVNWSPGAQGLLINREFLNDVGGFTYNCVAYEQWLAVQAAERGWLSLFADCAPWIHMPSLGFTELGEQKVEPVHRDIYSVCKEVYGEPDPRKVVRKFVVTAQEVAINKELEG